MTLESIITTILVGGWTMHLHSGNRIQNETNGWSATIEIILSIGPFNFFSVSKTESFVGSISNILLNV